MSSCRYWSTKRSASDKSFLNGSSQSLEAPTYARLALIKNCNPACRRLYPGDFARIIGLHTYSQSPHRNYDIRLTGNWVERGGFRFEDFVLTRRKEENDGND